MTRTAECACGPLESMLDYRHPARATQSSRGLCPPRGHQYTTLHHARNVTGVETIYSVIGGTHLIRASEAQMELTIAALKEFGVQRLGVSHCTGMPAAMRLAQEFGPGFFFNNSGSMIGV